MPSQVLLYYAYCPISDPSSLAARQLALCKELSLTGRVIFAAEGINGTLEGTIGQTEEYVRRSLEEPAFKDISYKRSVGDGNAFTKLSVKASSEIVSAHLEERDVNPYERTGKHLEPEELHAWIHSEKEFYIVDMRNDYEHAVGHFAGSILPPIRHFRQLPEVIPLIQHLKGKTIITVCTGGVRCEKASGFLLENGFAEVYQLNGGIVTYMERYPGEDFNGALYVFDGRVTMAFRGNRLVIGRCERCGSTTEAYVNCMNSECNRHFICCSACASLESPIYCGKECRPLVRETETNFETHMKPSRCTT